MATQTNLNLAQSLYIAYYGRAADSEGLEYWADRIEAEGVGAILNAFGNSAEYQDRFSEMSNDALIENLYLQMFDRLPDIEGLQFYKGLLESGEKSLAQIAYDILAGAQEPDTTTLATKLEAANAYTASAGDDFTLEGSVAAVRDAGVEVPDSTLTLTQRADDLKGQDGVDTTFTAPVTQNETGSGQLANTFETGDVLDGGADSRNVLEADLIASGSVSGANIIAPAISAETTNIQEVYFRAQTVNLDLANTNQVSLLTTIDAEKMAGVEQWWTDNSRADITIEDIRSRPTDTTFGVRQTDMNVSYSAYFNPLFLFGDETAESQLIIQIAELDGGNVNASAKLENISVSALTFELDGEEVTISSDAMAEANTWDDLQSAIVEALGEEGLGDLTVEHLGNGEFLLFDEEGRPFTDQGGFTASATTNQQIDIRNRISQDFEVEEGATETTIVLDGAGNGSQGGTVDVGVMSGLRGVEVFDVLVGRDSHIARLESTNATSDAIYLEEVNVAHLEDATGNLQIGTRTREDDNNILGTVDDRLNTDGLVNVRSFDASGFTGELKVGAQLGVGIANNDDLYNRYLDGAEDVVTFEYLLGDGGSNLSLAVANDVASDADFALNIEGGAGDDRINLSGLQFKNSTSIDGAGGSNTVEVDTTTGAAVGGNTAAENSWAAFENVDTLVVAGTNDTVQNIVTGNMTALDGGQVIVATGDENSSQFNIDDTVVNQLRSDTALEISGKNQTLGAGNSNEDQFIGDVSFGVSRTTPDSDNIAVNLANTGRLDAELSVVNLNVTSTATGVSTLDLTSSGRRSTENLVQNSALAGIDTANLDGTQNLAIHIASMEVDADGNSTDSTVDGSELEGTLDLAINADILNGSSDVLTGTEGESDRLYVYGTDATATVTGFETVQLGLSGSQFSPSTAAFSGTFDAAGVSGVDQYDLVNLDAATTLDNLGNDELITVASGADQDITLNAASESAQITVDFLADYTSDLTVVDYRTVTLDMAGSATGINYDFDLTLNDGVDPTYTRTLEITGGVSANDSITLDELDVALTTVDYSTYSGSFIGGETVALGTLGGGFGWNDTAGSNAEIVVNSNAFVFSVAGSNDGGTTIDSTDFITEFVFTSDANDVGTVWQIDDFQVFGALNGTTQSAAGDEATLQDRTLLNLRGLDLSETDVSQRDLDDWWTNDADQAEYDAAFAGFANGASAGDHTVIVGNEDENFTILLTGITVGNLNDENFLYAA